MFSFISNTSSLPQKMFLLFEEHSIRFEKWDQSQSEGAHGDYDFLSIFFLIPSLSFCEMFWNCFMVRGFYVNPGDVVV